MPDVGAQGGEEGVGPRDPLLWIEPGRGRRMEVRRQGQALPLTAKELALLELMMSAPGRMFSRERILSNVWGVDSDPLTNVVDVYIRRLRGKLDEPGQPSWITTVRGMGYRLDPPEPAAPRP